MPRDLLAIVIIVAVALPLATCGGGHKRAASPPIVSSSGFPIAESLDDTLAELDAYPCPDGVDKALFAELKAALAAGLTTNNQHLTTGRFVSAPPTGEDNCVTDLALTDNGDGAYTLSWHYRNLGDYDQNGTVGISDITPIAMHYGEAYDIEDVNCLLAVIDGSGNGVVSIVDITPIAMYYGVELDAYAVAGDDTWQGPFGVVYMADLSETTGIGRKQFEHLLDPPEYEYYCVVPRDSLGEHGEQSNVAELSLEPDPPTNLQASDGAYTDRIQITWATSIRAINYKVYRATSRYGSYTYVGQNILTVYDDYVNDTGTYYYKATAHNDYGDSDYSVADSGYRGVWHIVAVDTAGDVGRDTSLAVVNGNPAISYCDTTNGNLKYVRATDTGGSSWGTPQTVDSAGDVGRYTSLTVVNGNPAISYRDSTNDDLKYVWASDPGGSAWGTPLIVDGTGSAGYYTSLAVVNGNPAISYWDWANDDLKYVRATDAGGSSWDTPVIVDGVGYVGWYTSLAVVDGNPAISYCDSINGYLKYVRASDANGASWGAPIAVDSAVVLASHTSLEVVNGNPAISYCDNINDDLRYVRATDADGSAWGTPLIVDSTGNVGWHTSLTVVSGNPAISYRDSTNYNLKYVRASDPDGSVWHTPLIVDCTGDVGINNSLAVVNGDPAISYFDNTNKNLKYAIYLSE